MTKRTSQSQRGRWLERDLHDLSIHAVIALELEPDVDDVDGGEDGDNCLTQTDGGRLFVWSAATLQKLDAFLENRRRDDVEGEANPLRPSHAVVHI